MKKFFFAIAFLATSVCSYAQWYWQEKPLNKKDFLKLAAAKYTIAFEYELADGEKTLTRVLEFGANSLPSALYQKGTDDNGDSINTEEVIYKFDGNGRLTKQITAGKTEGTEWSAIYTYAKGDNPTKETVLDIDPATTVYTYDVKGRLTKSYTTVRMAALDKEGNPTSKRIDKPQERSVYVYDNKGRLKEKRTYNLTNSEQGNQPSFQMRLSYNEKNQITKLERLNEEGNVYNTETYEYNSNGLLTKATTVSDDEPAKTFVYEYCTTCKQSWK